MCLNEHNKEYLGAYFQLGQTRHGYALLNSFRRVAVNASFRDVYI